jgi:hypothetical protein
MELLKTYSRRQRGRPVHLRHASSSLRSTPARARCDRSAPGASATTMAQLQVQKMCGFSWPDIDRVQAPGTLCHEAIEGGWSHVPNAFWP